MRECGGLVKSLWTTNFLLIHTWEEPRIHMCVCSYAHTLEHLLKLTGIAVEVGGVTYDTELGGGGGGVLRTAGMEVEQEQNLASVLSSYSFGGDIIMETRDDGMFGQDEANTTRLSHVQKVANSRKAIIQMVSDDIYVFVL